MKQLIYALLLTLMLPLAASAQDYLYQRDVIVPPYQTLREFFDMPDRPGHYEVTLISDAIGPLTFRVIRIHGDHEETLGKKRSFHIGSHSFQQAFNNVHGEDDVMVELSNSNPAAAARVTVFVVELP